MTGEDIKANTEAVQDITRAWGHFNNPKTEEERWQILYAQVRQELDRANAACSAALIEANGWRDRAQKAERALSKIREWMKTVSNEAEAN